MSKMNQKEATFQAVISVIPHENERGACAPSNDQKGMICQILFEGFKSNRIELTQEYSDKELKSYVGGLVSNWLRKDKRLNGGISYVTKNPGSRVGSSDPSLKAMRALLNSPLLTSEDKVEIQGHIDSRVAELNTSKQTVTIDYSALPADLQAKFNK